MAGTLQFDTFVFPVDPETLHTTYRHEVSVTPTTAGQWTVENVAYLGRTVEGEGVFYGSGAYASFQQLAAYIKNFQAKVLQHPKFGSFRAFLTKLEAVEEPNDGCLRYRFVFVESPAAV